MELLRVVLLPLGQHFYGHLRTAWLHDLPIEVGDWLDIGNVIEVQRYDEMQHNTSCERDLKNGDASGIEG